MAVHIRLARHGSKKSPYYRIVVADVRSARDGRFIEHIGIFDPRTSEPTLRLDRDRLDHWIRCGARPTPTAARLLKQPSATG